MNTTPQPANLNVTSPREAESVTSLASFLVTAGELGIDRNILVDALVADHEALAIIARETQASRR